MTSAAVSSSQIPTEERKRRPSAGVVALTVWGCLGILFLFFPVIIIVIYSFNAGSNLQIWEGFSIAPYIEAFTRPDLLAPVAVSFRAAFGSALLSAALGTLGGIALARAQRSRWLPALVGVLGLVMVTPEIINAVSLLPWFVELGQKLGFPLFNDGIVRLIVGHSLFSSAVVTFVVRARVQGLNPQLEEAAADLGASPARRFFDITLPLIGPAVVSGALLSFTLSLDNTVLSSFISVAGSNSWPVYVWASVKSTLRPEIAAMSTLLLAVTIIVLVLAAVILRSASKKSGAKNADLSSMLG